MSSSDVLPLMFMDLMVKFQFAMLETVLTSILDQFKHLRPHKTRVILAMSVCFFILGLPLCTNVSIELYQIIVSYIYFHNNF